MFAYYLVLCNVMLVSSYQSVCFRYCAIYCMHIYAICLYCIALHFVLYMFTSMLYADSVDIRFVS